MKIIFLNVWGGKRESELAEFISKEAPDTDVFCFQEATDKMKQHNQDVLHGYSEISDYKFISDHDDFPQSIFVKEGMEVLSSGTLLAGDRGAGLGIYAEVRTEGGRLYICNVHGTAQPGDKLDTPGRLRQSEEVIKFFVNKDAPVIIGGDFNVSPDTRSIEMFSEHGYRDLIKEFSIDTTRNRLVWDLYPDNKQYYSDYVFMNNKVQCKGFNVPKIEVSDHLPLILEV